MALNHHGSTTWYKIVAPSREYNGVTMGVQFKNGVGWTQDKKTADRLTWDFHYESQLADPNEEDKRLAEARRARENAEYAQQLLRAGVMSRETAWRTFAAPNANSSLLRLEKSLDHAEAKVLGQPEAWLRGRVREVVELVPLGY